MSGTGNEKMTVRSTRRPRERWADAFRQMSAQGDDRLLDQPTPDEVGDQRVGMDKRADLQA